MNGKNIKMIKIVFLIVITLCSIGFEFLYRDHLFEKNLIWAEDMQSNWNESAKTFFDFITNLGTLPMFLPMFIIIYLWFPITKSYTFILNFAYSSFIMNMLKLIYSNPRPYWVKPSLMLSCSPGYGNPSGHAFDSLSVYLSIWHMITDLDFFKRHKSMKYLLLVLILVLVGAIVLSRIYLGVHSVNQIIYGITLGFCAYFLVFNVLEVDKTEPKEFFLFFKKKNIYNTNYNQIHCVLNYIPLNLFLQNK